jgi:hypothetical protein
MRDSLDDDGREVVESSGRYALTLGPEGHQIWDLDAPRDADAIGRFPSGDAGFEAAWSRYQELGRQERRGSRTPIRALCVAALVVEAGLVVSAIITGVLYFKNQAFFGEGVGNLQRFSVLSQMLTEVTVGMVAILITIWLQRRLTADVPVKVLPRPTSSDRGSAQDAPSGSPPRDLA